MLNKPTIPKLVHLIIAWLCFLVLSGSSVTAITTGSINVSSSFVDISGLGEGTDFYDFYYIEVHLPFESYTVYNLETADHFVGETEDGLVACDLIRYTASNGIEVTTGRVHVRSIDKYYEILPDATGTCTFSTKSGKDITYNEPLQLSSWEAFKSLVNPMKWFRESRWSGSSQEDGTDARDRPAEIDVMVIWTENGECLKSGLEVGCELTDQTEANMEAAIEFMVADSNVVHANSETGVTLNLVHKQRDTSNFKEGDVFKTVLRTLVRLPYLIHFRNKHKADLVQFIVDRRDIPDAGCGIGMSGNWAGRIPFTITNPILAYSATVADCTAYFTPVHEWGHNMGCNHDRGTGDTCDKCGTYYGWRSPTGKFHTIMSYSCARNQCDDFQGDLNCPAIPYFSGEATYRGESLGGEDNSCREQIREYKHWIKNYR